MINFSFGLNHPFEVKFKNFWCKTWGTPFKNKYIELEVYTTEYLIGCNFFWSRKCDHAGVDMQISIAGICVHFNFYDNRHWDYNTSKWHT